MSTLSHPRVTCACTAGSQVRRPPLPHTHSSRRLTIPSSLPLGCTSQAQRDFSISSLLVVSRERDRDRTEQGLHILWMLKKKIQSCNKGSRQLSGLFIGKGKVLECRKEKQGRAWVEQKGSIPSLQREGRICRERRRSGEDLKVQSR